MGRLFWSLFIFILYRTISLTSYFFLGVLKAQFDRLTYFDRCVSAMCVNVNNTYVRCVCVCTHCFECIFFLGLSINLHHHINHFIWIDIIYHEQVIILQWKFDLSREKEAHTLAHTRRERERNWEKEQENERKREEEEEEWAREGEGAKWNMCIMWVKKYNIKIWSHDSLWHLFPLHHCVPLANIRFKMSFVECFSLFFFGLINENCTMKRE